MNRIIGSSFSSIFRASDMLSFNLGKSITRDNGRTYPEYSIHVQTPWRFIKGEEILLASSDMFLPHSPDGTDPDRSIFDVLQETFANNFAGSVVDSVAVSSKGDLKITFDNGTVFEAFVTSSRKDEFWRFIDFTKVETEHIVVFDVL